MNRKERQYEAEQARQRALGLGESGDVSAIPELVTLSRHDDANVRRMAASAIGKLSDCGDAHSAVSRLCEMTRDTKPQVRQYAMKSLSKIGAASALPALRDVSNRPGEKDYNLKSAMQAIACIAQAVQTARDASPVACQRCGGPTTSDERQMSETQFQRPYCGACFNAVFIERRNFDMKVQNQKTILTADRTVVQSRGERRIAEWLSAHGLDYRYDDKFQIIMGYAIRPDFYLPLFDVYIEYWGLDTTDYKIGMHLKQKLYQQQGKKLISLYPADLPCLGDRLTQMFQMLGFEVASGT
jgi:hypothetical protein